MKKNFVNRFVAALLLACMVLSLPVFAVDRYYLKVTISEKNAPNYELVDYSGYLSLDESLTAEVAIVVGANFTEKNRQDESGLYGFQSSTMRELVKNGLKARQTGGITWTGWVNRYYDDVINVNDAAAGLDMKAKLKDLTTKVSQLTPGETYIISYTPDDAVTKVGDPARGNTYTVTITLCTGTICDGTGDCPSLKFNDLDTDMWYHEAVDYVVRHGIMNGYGNGEFGPEDFIDRAMMAQLMYNMETDPKASKVNAFPDVAEDKWYAVAVHWCVENNVVAGYDDGLYRPEQAITREEMVQLLYNYYVKCKGYAVTKTDDLSAYADGAQVAPYHREAMEWGVGSGLLSGKAGTSGNLLDPKGTATRAEAAQMIWNFCENVRP